MSITLSTISCLYAIDDYLICIKKAESKIQKRFNRLRLLFQMVLSEIDNIDVDLQVHIEKQFQDFSEIYDGLNMLSDEEEKIYISTDMSESILDLYITPDPVWIIDTDSIVYKTIDNPYIKHIRDHLENKITHAIHKNKNLYIMTSVIVSAIRNNIKKDAFLGPLYKAGKIIIFLKGGMAVRYSMEYFLNTQIIPNLGKRNKFVTKLKQYIKTYFPNGDNDASINIHPSLKNFEKVRQKIIIIVNNTMEDYINKICLGEYQNIHKIIFKTKYIDFCDTCWCIKQSKKRSFIVTNHVPEYIIKTSAGKSRSMYCSINYTLPFILCRIKIIFSAIFGLISAEFLDVVIPEKNEHLYEFFTLSDMYLIERTIIIPESL